MQPPFPSPVATWRNDTYDAIDPSNPNNNQAGKTVIITGAGSGIGRATAIAFAAAGAERLVLIGRTEETLRETASLLPSDFKADIYPASVTNETQVRDIASKVGPWDVLILNAAHPLTPTTIVGSEVNEWWTQYEVSVKSVVSTTQAFVPSAKPGAAVYGIAAGALVMPPNFTPGYSAYLTAKTAQIKVLEFLASENPELFVVSVHPGMIDTGIFKSSGASPESLPMDTVELPAHFLVWLTQPKTRFLNGRMIWANWDVTELQAKANDILNSSTMTIAYNGWPFSPSQ